MTRILAIESSCDETAASVVEGLPPKIVASVVSSQINLHKAYGGVYPEVASRAHTERILPVIEEALSKAKISLDGVDAIAVTYGPGLIGALLIGVNTAKSLSYVLGKRLIPVNHLEGHIFANFVEYPKAPFPIVALTVAGGHTTLALLQDTKAIKVLGQTLDDAAGEAFDKGAKLLGLAYPGGPEIETLAKKGSPDAFRFPRPMVNDRSLDFSFAGLKTALLYTVRGLKHIDRKTKADLAASFQQAILETLVIKTIRAAKKHKARSIFLGGGVTANSKLRTMMKNAVKQELPDALLAIPPLSLVTDNAAMIGVAALYKLQNKRVTPWYAVKADPNAALT
jgi:N6-L-threonylcarbamoyladenine synthase